MLSCVRLHFHVGPSERGHYDGSLSRRANQFTILIGLPHCPARGYRDCKLCIGGGISARLLTISHKCPPFLATSSFDTASEAASCIARLPASTCSVRLFGLSSPNLSPSLIDTCQIHERPWISRPDVKYCSARRVA